MSVVRDNAYGLGQLNAGALAEAATDTVIEHMGLFQQPGAYCHILQRAGAVANTTGFTLIRQAEVFVDQGFTHADFFEDGFHQSFNGRDCVSRADIATLHAENAGLVAGDNIGRAEGGCAVFQLKKLNATIGADLATLTTANTGAFEVIFGAGTGRAQIARRW